MMRKEIGKTVIYFNIKIWKLYFGELKLNSGNPYKTYALGPIRIDRFYRYISY